MMNSLSLVGGSGTSRKYTPSKYHPNSNKTNMLTTNCYDELKAKKTKFCKYLLSIHGVLF